MFDYASGESDYVKNGDRITVNKIFGKDMVETSFTVLLRYVDSWMKESQEEQQVG